MRAEKLYDKTADSAREWVETMREEMPDLADVRAVAGDVAERAADWVGDVADRMVERMPGAAKAASRSRRRRWMAVGLIVATLAYLFGPGGADRRAKLQEMMGGETPTGTTTPPLSHQSPRET